MGEKNFREGGSGLFRVCCLDELVGCLGCLVGWLVGLKSYCYFTLLRGYAIFVCGISKKGLLHTYVYEGTKYKYLLIVFYIYVTVLWALFAYNGFANYRHMCITVWQVRVGLALVKDTYLLYIYIYCTTVIHNT